MLSRQFSVFLLAAAVLVLTSGCMFSLSKGIDSKQQEDNFIPSGNFLQSTYPATVHSTIIEPDWYEPEEPPDPLMIPRILRPLTDGRILLASFPDCFYFDAEGTQIDQVRLEKPLREMVEAVTEFRIRSNHHYDNRSFIEVVTQFEPGNLYGITANSDGKVWAWFVDDWFREGHLCEWAPDGTILKLYSSRILGVSGEDSRGERIWVSPFMLCDNERVIVYSTQGTITVIYDYGVNINRGRPDRSRAIPTSGRLYNDLIYSCLPYRRVRITEIVPEPEEPHSNWEEIENGGLYRYRFVITPPDTNFPWGIGLMPNGSRIEFWREEIYESEWDEENQLPNETWTAVNAELIEYDSEGDEIERLPYNSLAHNDGNPLDPFDSSIFDCIELDDGWLMFNPCEDGQPASALLVDRELNDTTVIEFMPRIATEVSEPTSVIVTSEQGTIEVGLTADMSILGNDLHPCGNGYVAIDQTGTKSLTLSYDMEILDVINLREFIGDAQNASSKICCLDSNGTAYVYNQTEGTIAAVSRDGDILREYEVNYCQEPAGGWYPYGSNSFMGYTDPLNFEIDSQDNLWIYSSDHIRVFNVEGELIRIFKFHDREPIVSLLGDGTLYYDEQALIPEHYEVPPIELDHDIPDRIIFPPVNNHGTAFAVLTSDGWIIIYDPEGNEVHRIDEYILREEERPEISPEDMENPFGPPVIRRYGGHRYFIGPDGYFYYFNAHPNPGNYDLAKLIAYDPETGDEINIDVYDFPYRGWTDNFSSVGPIPGWRPNGIWVDMYNRLVIYDYGSIWIYPLRDDDPLEPYDFIVEEALG